MQSFLPKPQNLLLKHKLILIFLCFIFSNKAIAQNPEINDVNLQLRAYFESLSKPSPAKAFL